MDWQLSACAESKELCFQLPGSRFEERAFYVSGNGDAIYGAECADKITNVQQPRMNCRAEFIRPASIGRMNSALQGLVRTRKTMC